MQIYLNKNWTDISLNNGHVGLPENWGIKSLKDVSYKIGDGLHGTPNYSEGSDYFFINGNNLKNGKIVVDKNTKSISKSEYLKHKKEFNSNTLFISINGTVGNLSFYENEPVVLGKSVGYANLINSENKLFIYYFFKSRQFKSSIEFDSTGSTIKNLSLASLRNTKILYPSELEQGLIVNLLTSLESVIQKRKKLISNIEKRNLFMTEELLSGRLRAREDNGQVIFYKNPEDNWIEEFSNGTPVRIPVDWNKQYLGSSNMPFIKSGVNKYEGIVDYYATGEINDFSVGKSPTGRFSYDKKPSRANVRVLGNTVYFARMKNTLKVIKFNKSENFLLSTGFIGVRPNENYVTLDYLYYTIRSDNFQKIKNKECKGATQETLSDGAARNIELLVPSTQEQKLITGTLKSLFNELEICEKILEEEVNLFTFILEELLTGSLRIKA